MWMPAEFRVLLVLALLLTIPGWFILAITGGGKTWSALQRWCVAVGLSIVTLPVMFYFLRFLPGIRLGQNKIVLLLVVLFLSAAWFLRKSWRELIRFDSLEWLSVAVFLATLFTRFWVAYLHPYPAWSDSLHHTLLTQLTSNQGRLPETLLPYAPTPLNMYHLGLYAISGVVQMLAQVPAYTALLWTAQALNGLCGLSVFLVLDRKIGRVGALVGAAVAGLFSFQPAWYVNWGRFTQVSSQTVLLIAWLVTWEAIREWRINPGDKRTTWGLTLVSALLNAGVFLLHYRVAYFYLPLLAITLGIELVKAASSKTLLRFFIGTVLVGLISLVFVSPALFSALKTYASMNSTTVNLPASQEAATEDYYAFPFRSLWQLGDQPWLLILAFIGMLYCLLRRKWFALVIAGWILLIVLEGLAYLLNIPLLNVTNLGAVLILLYLPVSLFIGQAAEEVWCTRLFTNTKFQQAALGIFLMSCFVASHLRVNGIEELRYFMTSSDIKAMQWIKTHTPVDARFAINTYFWLPTAPQGSDAGYWLPYFTGRKTTGGTMLLNLGPINYSQETIQQSLAVKSFISNYQSIDGLCSEEISYIYLGAKGDFTGKGMLPDRVKQVPGIELVYEKGGVSIFKVTCK